MTNRASALETGSAGLVGGGGQELAQQAAQLTGVVV